MGSPGKFRRYLSEEEKASILTYRTNYLGYKEQYLRETGLGETGLRETDQ